MGHSSWWRKRAAGNKGEKGDVEAKGNKGEKGDKGFEGQKEE